MHKLVFALLIGLYITSFSQDFIPENVFVYNRYTNNMRDKFLPVWQNTIKKNKIKRETYISYDIKSQTDQIPTPFDTIVFNYNSEGQLISSVSTSPYPGAESAVKLTTNYRYENGHLTGSTDSKGNSLQIVRDAKGRITQIKFQGPENELSGTYHYSGDQLMKVDLGSGDEGSVIVYEENVFIAQDTLSGRTTIGDKYGRIVYINSETVGLQNLFDPDERLTEAKLNNGGYTELTSFIYNGELLQEIIFTSYQGEIGADLKDSRITQSVKTEVQYE
mgnify:CR=1 FL=1